MHTRRVCPRCGSDVERITQVASVVLPGGLVEPRHTTTGWLCENEHFLALSEPDSVAVEPSEPSV